MSSKQGKAENVLESPQKIVVAVRASKEIPRTALVWALTHVVRAGDGILLLVVIPSHNSGIISRCLSCLPFFFSSFS